MFRRKSALSIGALAPARESLIPKGNKLANRKMIQGVFYLLPIVILIQAFFSLDLRNGDLSSDLFPPVSVSTSKHKPKQLEFVHITKTGGSAIEKAGYQDGIIWGACHYMNLTDVGCMAADLPYEAPNYQSYALTSPWHTPPKLLKKHVTEDLYPYHDADLFVVIRNPYSRILSEYYCPWLGFQARFRKNLVRDKDPNDPNIMNAWVQNMVKELSDAMDQFDHQNQNQNQGNVRGAVAVQAQGVNEDPYVLAQKHYINQAEYVYDGDKRIVKNIVHYENLSSEFDALMKDYGIAASLPPKETGGTYTEHNKGRLSHKDLYPETIALINKFAKADFEKFGYQMVERFEPNDGYSLEAKF